MAEPVLPPEPSAARPMAVLANAARALHGQSDADVIVRWALDATAALAPGTEVALCIISGDGTPSWATIPGRGAPFTRLADPRTFPHFVPVLDRGEATVIADLEATEIAYPKRKRISEGTGFGRLLAAPVCRAEGGVQGVLIAADGGSGQFGIDLMEAVVALAAHVGVALDNQAAVAHLEELGARGKEVVHRLQEAVRPPAPVVPFTELGVRYIAADPDAPTGGDLYDWLTLPNGDLHAAVVDVIGKGVEATKHALAVTHALRLLAVEGCPMEQIVGRADHLLTAQNPELVATLLVLRYNPETGEMTIVGAGHPPALLVHDGVATELAAPGIPIGWPGAGSHGSVNITLARADTVILYTDGLIEATKDILEGLETLARAAEETASYPAQAQARALVERQLADAARRDDSLALVLRRRSPASLEPIHLLGPFVHQFSPSRAAVPVARHLLRDWLIHVPVDATATDELLLVASELCANAVRHATGQPGGVVLRAFADANDVMLEVEDDVGLLEWPVWEPEDVPDPDAEQGRGLFLVQALTDEVRTDVDGMRSIVRVVKRAVVAHPQPAL